MAAPERPAGASPQGLPRGGPLRSASPHSRPPAGRAPRPAACGDSPSLPAHLRSPAAEASQPRPRRSGCAAPAGQPPAPGGAGGAAVTPALTPPAFPSRPRPAGRLRRPPPPVPPAPSRPAPRAAAGWGGASRAGSGGVALPAASRPLPHTGGPCPALAPAGRARRTRLLLAVVGVGAAALDVPVTGPGRGDAAGGCRPAASPVDARGCPGRDPGQGKAWRKRCRRGWAEGNNTNFVRCHS